MMSSRVTFATIEAAAIESERESPRTTVSTRQGSAGAPVAVDQRRGGRARQGGERPGHRPERGPEDVRFLDLAHTGRAHADLGAAEQLAVERAAPRRRQGLRIVEAGGQRRRVEHHRRGDHRPGPRPPPGLVDPGDRPAAGAFQREVRHPPARPF